MAGPAGGGRRGNRAVPMATLRPGARGWGRRSISRPRPVLGGLRGPRLRAWGGLDRREGSGISSPRCGWGRGGGSRLGVRPGRGFHPGGVWTRPRRRVAKVRPTERSTSQIGKNQAKYDHDARIKTATNREGLPQRSLPPAAGCVGKRNVAVHALEHDSAVNRSEALTQATARMHLEHIMLSKRRQTQKATQRVMPSLRNIQDLPIQRQERDWLRKR
ncbi:uncharacterized protein [Symphalangus syndactylus]|uniref:uncharacterized protein isoform X1 n=1 Tax=Symphalangus syndactylus TaxID=9590 RepID=UPI002442EC71|nr:uncharacterized protein LOC129466486 isoform X2 [Symphalangus syndactylus]